MSSMFILLIAVLIVVGGVLVLKLHAALALLFAAIITTLLTPSENVYQHEIMRVASRVVEPGGNGGLATLQSGKGKPVLAGNQWIFRRAGGKSYRHVGHAELEVVQREENRFRVRLQPADPELKLALDDLVIHYTLVEAADATAEQPVGERVARGFGETCGKIGILIALASIIGKCLLDSGAAERIVVTIRAVLGGRTHRLRMPSLGTNKKKQGYQRRQGKG